MKQQHHFLLLVSLECGFTFRAFDDLNGMPGKVSLAFYVLYVRPYVSLDVTLSPMVGLTCAAAAVKLQQRLYV